MAGQYDPRQQQPQYQQAPYPQPQYNPQQYAPQPPQAPRTSGSRIACIGCLGLVGLGAIIAGIGAAASHSPSSSAAAPLPTLPTAPVHSAAPANAPAAQTVTYQVVGSAADVTYGPAGSNYSGAVPLNVSKPLGTPLYYSITAQLQGSGAVACRILVDGNVVSQSSATGGYNIASCEISPDPLSGQWQNTNG